MTTTTDTTAQISTTGRAVDRARFLGSTVTRIPILFAIAGNGAWACNKSGEDRDSLRAALREHGDVAFMAIPKAGLDEMTDRYGLGRELGLALLEVRARALAPRKIAGLEPVQIAARAIEAARSRNCKTVDGLKVARPADEDLLSAEGLLNDMTNEVVAARKTAEALGDQTFASGTRILSDDEGRFAGLQILIEVGENDPEEDCQPYSHANAHCWMHGSPTYAAAELIADWFRIR